MTKGNVCGSTATITYDFGKNIKFTSHDWSEKMCCPENLKLGSRSFTMIMAATDLRERKFPLNPTLVISGNHDTPFRPKEKELKLERMEQ